MQDEIEKMLSLTPNELVEKSPSTVSESLVRALLLSAMNGDSDALKLVFSVLQRSPNKKKTAEIKIVGGRVNQEAKDKHE